MSQTSKIVALTVIAFVAYIAAKGELAQYLGVFMKPKKAAE